MKHIVNNFKNSICMKRVIILMCTGCLTLLASACFAQDAIVMNDAEEIRISDSIYAACNSVADVASFFEEETADPVTIPSAVAYGSFLQQVGQQSVGTTGTIRDYPDLYRQYRSGKRKATIGTALLITGGVFMVGGVAAAFAAVDEENDELGAAGAGVLLLGTAAVSVGIPFMIVGNIRKGKASRAYRRAISETQPQETPHLQLNLYGNGAGLSFVF
jgi:hypothetical protein